MRVFLKLFFLLVFSIFINGCKLNNEPNPKQTIRELMNRFPQLIEGKSFKERNFKLLRTVINGETKIQLQLYSQDDDVKNNHQIIVFIDTNNKCYGLPLFDNKHRDYWEFQNDRLISNVEKLKTTFEKEFNSTIAKIMKNNVINNEYFAHVLLFELITSLLHSQNINKWNGSLELCKTQFAKSDIPIENEKLVNTRFDKNFNDIKKELERSVFNYFYFDEKNRRIYMIDDMYYYKKNKFKFKCFRQDFGSEPLRIMSSRF